MFGSSTDSARASSFEKMLEREVDERLLTADPSTLTDEPERQRSIGLMQFCYQESASMLSDRLSVLVHKAAYSRCIRDELKLAEKP